MSNKIVSVTPTFWIQAILLYIHTTNFKIRCSQRELSLFTLKKLKGRRLMFVSKVSGQEELD